MITPAVFQQRERRTSTAFDAGECDFHLYGRQSDAGSVGNASTDMQLEGLPDAVADHFGIDIEGPRVRRYYEQASAVDGNVSLDFRAMAYGGGVGIKGFGRPAFLEMLANCVDQYRATKRMQIICVSLLNRLGRSKQTVSFVETAALDCDGLLRIWSADARGMLLDPLSQEGRIQLTMMVEVSGKGESDAKRTFVTTAKKRIAENDPTRSLGERLPGYRQYPCDRSGRRLDQLTTAPDHWRHEVDPDTVAIPQYAFDAIAKDIKPREVVGLLQQEFGDHPINKSPWTIQQLLWMLRNPMYIGRRGYNRAESVAVGRSTKRRQNSPERWTYSPYAEELRIIDDSLFFQVQRKLESWGHGRDRMNNIGRPLAIPLLFHRTSLLRCAICGSAMQVHKSNSRYMYRCVYLSDTRGLPMCQSHDAQEFDEFVSEQVTALFGPVKAWGERYRKSVKRDRSRDKFNALNARLKDAETDLSTMRINLLKLAGTMEESEIKAMQDQIRIQADQVDTLRQQVLRFGDDTFDRSTAETIDLIDSMSIFREADLASKQSLLGKLFAGMWVWPDKGLWMQWHTDKEEDCERLTGGRRLREGRKWDSIDWKRVEDDVRKLIEVGEIPQARLNEYVPESTTYTFLKGAYGGYTPSTLLRLLKACTESFVDTPRLKEDVTAWIKARRAEGWTWYRLAKETPLTAKTIQKIASGGSVRRDSYMALADKVGGMEQYTTLPDWVYVPEHLDEMVGWTTANESLGDEEKTRSGIPTLYYQTPKWNVTYSGAWTVPLPKCAVKPPDSSEGI